MGMMGLMVLVMVVGLGAILVLGLLRLMVNQEAIKHKRQPISDVAEKPKRGYFMLSDDGELVGLEDDEQAEAEKSK